MANLLPLLKSWITTACGVLVAVATYVATAPAEDQFTNVQKRRARIVMAAGITSLGAAAKDRFGDKNKMPKPQDPPQS